MVKFSSGKFLPTSEQKNEKIPVYGGNGITGWHNESICNEPTIVFGRVGAYCGSVHLTKEKSWITDNAIFIKKLENELDIEYLFKYVSRLKIGLLAEVAAHPKISQAILNNLLIQYPENITEQQKIASILSNVDNLISSYDKVIDSTKLLKQGLMQQLLTRGIGHKKFKKVKWLFGKEVEIPEEWKIIPLEKCVKEVITYGIVQAGPHLENGIPYIRTSDMTKNKLTLDGMLRTSKEIASKFKRSTVRTGELVFGIRATVGKTLEIPEELDGANLTQGTARISPNENFNNKFLLYALVSNYTKIQITSIIKGTTFLEITLQNLRKIKIISPILKEQQKITSILSIVDSKINELESKKTILEKIKKGLMQKLLTGQIRVKIKN